jgi:TatA/E family protein of Tat protein translocase
VLALILDSLGSTELLFILVIALIFFGPRKLPQLARSMGKSMAEFRKASEDFKRTWEREVAMESVHTDASENSILGEQSTHMNENGATIDVPLVEPVVPELVVPRQSANHSATDPLSPTTAGNETTSAEPLRKRDWL